MAELAPVVTYAVLLELLKAAGIAWEIPFSENYSLDPGETGTATLTVPSGLIHLYTAIRESGDPTVKWKLYLDAISGDDFLGVSEHFVYERHIQVSRKRYRRHFSYLVYENTDTVNPAFFQIGGNLMVMDSKSWEERWERWLKDTALKVLGEEEGII